MTYTLEHHKGEFRLSAIAEISRVDSPHRISMIKGHFELMHFLVGTYMQPKMQLIARSLCLMNKSFIFKLPVRNKQFMEQAFIKVGIEIALVSSGVMLFCSEYIISKSFCSSPSCNWE